MYPTGAQAYSHPDSPSVTGTSYITDRYSDGSYIVCTIIQENTIRLDAVSPYKTQTASSVFTYYNNSNKPIWYIKLTGTFKYNGSSASCTHSDISAGSYDSCWTVSKCSSSHSGASAIGTATATHYKGNTITNTISKVAYLTCSPSGNLS